MTDTSPVRPARRTSRGGLVRLVACVLAALVAAVGVAAIHEALAVQGTVSGPGALTRTVDYLGDLRLSQGLVVGAGVVVFLVGVLLLRVAAGGRRAPIRLEAAPFVELARVDVARAVSAAVEQVDGVLEVSSAVSRKTVVVRLVTTGGTEVPERAQQIAAEALAALIEPPRVQIRVTNAHDSQQESAAKQPETIPEEDQE